MALLKCAKTEVEREGEVESSKVRRTLSAFDRLCLVRCMELLEIQALADQVVVSETETTLRIPKNVVYI
jgi:hypothetical protein